MAKTELPSEVKSKTASVSIIVPTYNGRDLLGRCLASALRACRVLEPPGEVLVVDNCSSDGTAEFCRRAFPEVQLLPQKGNLGFAGGCDVGIRSAQAEFCLLLNQDAWIEPGDLQILLDTARSGDFALVGPLILNPDETVQSPGLTIDFLGQPSWAPPGKDPLYLDGSVLLIRRTDYLELGGFDDRFFAYFEETDFQWRALICGKQIAFVQAARARHVGDAFDSAAVNRPRSHPLSWRRQYLGRRNQLAMLIKNYSMRRLIYVLPLWIGAAIIECAGALITGRVRQAGVYMAAVGWNMRHLPGTLQRRRAVQMGRVLADGEIAARFGPPFTRVRAGLRFLDWRSGSRRQSRARFGSDKLL